MMKASTAYNGSYATFAQILSKHFKEINVINSFCPTFILASGVLPHEISDMNGQKDKKEENKECALRRNKKLKTIKAMRLRRS